MSELVLASALVLVGGLSLRFAGPLVSQSLNALGLHDSSTARTLLLVLQVLLGLGFIAAGVVVGVWGGTSG